MCSHPFLLDKYLSFFPTNTYAKYHTSSLSRKMNSVSFWVWMSGRDDGILLVSVNDQYGSTLAAVVTGDLGKNWVNVKVNVSSSDRYKKKVTNLTLSKRSC